MYDMPRMSIPESKVKNYKKYHLEGIWKVQVSADGTTAGPVYLQLKFEVELPSGNVINNWALDVSPRR
jgi:hypothetical protein